MGAILIPGGWYDLPHEKLVLQRTMAQHMIKHLYDMAHTEDNTLEDYRAQLFVCLGMYVKVDRVAQTT